MATESVVDTASAFLTLRLARDHLAPIPNTGDDCLLRSLAFGLALDPLPELLSRDPSVPHAPTRRPNLTPEQKKLALKNALRYFPNHLHEQLAKEFLDELDNYGHIYMYRFRPIEFEMRAYPIDIYPARSRNAAAIMLMIMNNLDPRVAQFPHELITYGGNGSVFQNWVQFRITMQYLAEMTDDQTLVMYSGHPMGLFPSHRDAPRVVVTNGMVIPNYSSRAMYEVMYATGVSQYGQMTAGSFMYIGPQGIVHGTVLTVLGAARKYLGVDGADLRGVVYVTSGLGGMSGAQGKATKVLGCITVIAEVDEAPLQKRYDQGWIERISTDLEEVIRLIKECKRNKEPLSLGYHGNAVAMWERLAEEEEMIVDLGSDQTSLHNAFGGGYYPVQLTLEESKKMMVDDLDQFKELIQESLRRQVTAINRLTSKGMKFWDYGNSFLLEASRAGADIMDSENPNRFKYPSYVQHIMGDIFSLGFGPFRWVCTSGNPEDLRTTDHIAAEVLKSLAKTAPTRVRAQLEDNILWIERAEQNQLVVGSQARILYSDAAGRIMLAKAFNDAIRDGRISAPIVLGRDHHDVSGTDSPYRETSNITDGSEFTADMAIQNVIGDAARGATWVSIHNGGGVGWGEVINGGFGTVLDGTEEAGLKAMRMLMWDVNNGVARRAWSGNDNAEFTIRRTMEAEPTLRVTLPNHASDDLLDKLII